LTIIEIQFSGEKAVSPIDRTNGDPHAVNYIKLRINLTALTKIKDE
jgi:hypothetical protein